MLAPIFDEAADKVTQEFTQPGQVVMGKVDCDKESKYLNVNCFSPSLNMKPFKIFYAIFKYLSNLLAKIRLVSRGL